MELWMDFLAEHRQRTIRTIRLPGGTAISSKKNDSMAKIRAFLRRENFAYQLIYLLWFFSGTKAESTANTNAVGIAYDAPRNTIQITQKQIRSLSAYTGDAQ